jgi:hypothetical protein
MTNTPNDIDLLMSADPLDMSDADIDAIIAYNRNQRAKREAAPGGKGRAKKDTAGPALDLAKLGLKVTKPGVERRD